MSSQELERRTPQQELMARLEGENVQKALVALLPENVTPDRFRRVFGTALMANPDLAEAETNSVITSLLAIAGMGLMPDGREAAIVVRQNRKKGIKEATAQAMVAGVRKRFADHGWTIRTQHVHANDDFEYVLVPEEDVTRHVRVRPGDERGDLVYAYAIGTHRDGRRQVKVIDRDRAMAAKAKAQYTGPGSPWQEHEPAMWEKTAAHDFSKQVGLSEDDRMVAVFAPTNGHDSTAALYGPEAAARTFPEGVDPETGEITSGTTAPRDGDEPTAPADQQVAAADDEEGGPPAAPPLPTAAAAPDPDPEPTLLDDAAQVAKLAGETVVPNGAFKDKTLAEVDAMTDEDTDGNKVGQVWLAWAARNPGRVGVEVHAALQAFRPDLFDKES